MPNLIRS